MKRKNNPLITGTIILTLTGLVSRIIGFFYRIFLSHLFGEEGMGIYQLIAPVLALSFSFTAAGLQTAVSKFVASETSTRDYKSSFRILLTGFVLSFTLSLGCSWFIYTNSVRIASGILLEPRCAPLLRIIALSIPFSAVHSIANGYFYGIKSTKLPAFTQLAEQFVRVGSVYAIYIAALKKGLSPTISFAVVGLVLGECASMLLSLAAVYLRFYRVGILKHSSPRHYLTRDGGRYPAIAQKLLGLAIPLMLNRIVINILQSIEAIYIPESLRAFGMTTKEALSTYGVLTGMALPLIFFPSALTNSVSVLLLPIVSEADAVNNRQAIRRAVHKSVLYCSVFGAFCTSMFLLFGRFAGRLLFHSSLAGGYILTLSFICPFLYVSSTLASILHGLGKAAVTFFINLLCLSIRLCFVFFCIPSVGIKGYLWALLFSELLSTFLDYIAVKHYTK